LESGNTIDPFDDLFEPFELEEGPPQTGEPQTPAPTSSDDPLERPPDQPEIEEPITPATTVVCASCGTANPAHNRHCEQCAARIGSGPLPVAPAPMIRATPGGRALTVLGGVLLIVLLAVLLLNLRSGGDETAASSSTITTTTEVPSFVNLEPFSVTASSSFPGFEVNNLIDSDEDSYWNDGSLRGNDAWLEFAFAQPVQITEIELQNLSNEEKFRRNYRIKSLVITVDDLKIEFSEQIDDSKDPQRIQIGSLGTTQLRIEVRSTYPAENYDGNPPFDELALQSVLFFGTRVNEPAP